MKDEPSEELEEFLKNNYSDEHRAFLHGFMTGVEFMKDEDLAVTREEFEDLLHSQFEVRVRDE